MQTTVELDCSHSIKLRNKRNCSSKPKSKLWFRHCASAVLLLCFRRPFVEQKHDTWTVPKSSYFVLLFSSLIGYFVTSDCTAFATAFMIGLLKNVCVKRSSRFLVTVPCHALHAYSGQVAGCIIDCSQIVEQFHPGKWLVLFDWCLLFYWSFADRGAVLCREMIGFVWLIFLVACLCILYWLLTLCADFINGNGQFCLSDILTLIVSVLLRWKNTMSKKQRLAEGFSPDAIAGRLAEKTRIQEKMENIVLKLQRSDCSYILRNNTIHCGKPSHSQVKRKSLIIIQIQEVLWRN